MSEASLFLEGPLHGTARVVDTLEYYCVTRKPPKIQTFVEFLNAGAPEPARCQELIRHKYHRNRDGNYEYVGIS